MSTIFSDQQVLAGQRIGISTAYAVLIYIIIACLLPLNTYHLSTIMSNLLGNSWVGYFSYPMSAALTAAEMPIVQSLVTNYRLDPDSRVVKIQASVLTLLIVLTVMGGNTSQFISADKKDAAIQSHRTQEQSIDGQKKTLESEWRIATRKANQIDDATDRAIAISQANSAYYSGESRLNNSLSKHQQTRPTSGIESGSFMHVVLVNVISLSLVLVSMFLSGFLSVYHTTLVASPAFSFMSKKAHGWLSAAKNFKTSNHEISPINDSATGYVKVDKPDERTSTVNDTVNRPAPHDSLLSTSSDTTPEQGARAPKQLPEEGAKVDYAERHYLAIKEGVLNQSIVPTTRPIKAGLNSLMVKFVNDAEREKKAAQILIQLRGEGVIIDNPKGGRGLAKYVINPDYSERGTEAIQDDGDEIGEFEITTRCGSCGEYDYTPVDALLDKQKGIVECSGCGKKYVAQSHLTNDSNQPTLALRDKAIAERKGVIPVAGAGISIGEDGISPTVGIGAIIGR